MIYFEIFNSFRKKSTKNGYMAIKKDMEKACDRLECDFVKKYLTDLGFCARWSNWIIQCITTSSFKVIVNDGTGNFFSRS